MDRSTQQRDMVYCHECDNEWYRDEHGLECPECHSDFTEIIEQGHDPREEPLEEVEELPPHNPLRDHNPWAHQHAPDPDEDDISNVEWHRTGPGGLHFSFTRNMQGGPQQPAAGQPTAGNFTTMLQSILGGRPLPQQATPGSNSSAFPQVGRSESTHPVGGMPQATLTPGTNVRIGGGPGFQWRITTQQGPLHPRDANNPQPQGEPFDDLQHMLQIMFGAGHPGMQRDQAGPFAAMGPLGSLLGGLLNPANMQHGDAVYSQEALDRVISQLMEQNASGNAPGPASAEAISSLPKKTITTADLGNEGKADCSICMDEVNIGEQVTILPCHHWFHGDCVKAWLNEHDTCPHCRQGIMPKDAPPGNNRPRAPNEPPRHDVTWGQGEGTHSNPWVIPDSPTQRRRSNPRSPRGSTSSASRDADNSGLFNRMRNAFGGGGGSG